METPMNFPDFLPPELSPWKRDPGAARIAKALRAAGGEARIVGGAVRDALLGGKTADIDFAADLEPRQVEAALTKDGIKTVPTGINHGTLTAVIDKKGYEITSLRRDVATDGRHADVSFTKNWAEDAARRDFTFNALYLDEEGHVYDFTDGRADLAAKHLRFIGDPRARIREDYLRVLRFFRFMAQLSGPQGAFKPDPDGLAACRELAEGMDRLSAERVSRELLRLLNAPDPSPALKLMIENGILLRLVPEMGFLGRLQNLVQIERVHGIPPDPLRRLAALAPMQVEKIARRLKFSKAQTQRMNVLPSALSALQQVEDGAGFRNFLYDYGKEAALDAVLLLLAEGEGAASSFLPEIEKWEKPVFPLEGKDLIALGLLPGPEIGAILSQIESWWRACDFAPTRQECLDEAERKINAR